MSWLYVERVGTKCRIVVAETGSTSVRSQVTANCAEWPHRSCILDSRARLRTGACYSACRALVTNPVISLACFLWGSLNQVSALVSTFGVDWALEKLFPPALAVFEKSTNYLHRMTALLIVGVRGAMLCLGSQMVYSRLGCCRSFCKTDWAE